MHQHYLITKNREEKYFRIVFYAHTLIIHALQHINSKVLKIYSLLHFVNAGWLGVYQEVIRHVVSWLRENGGVYQTLQEIQSNTPSRAVFYLDLVEQVMDVLSDEQIEAILPFIYQYIKPPIDNRMLENEETKISAQSAMHSIFMHKKDIRNKLALWYGQYLQDIKNEKALQQMIQSLEPDMQGVVLSKLRNPLQVLEAVDGAWLPVIIPQGGDSLAERICNLDYAHKVWAAKLALKHHL